MLRVDTGPAPGLAQARSLTPTLKLPTYRVRRDPDVTPVIYLRAAQAYMLISMPTGTSTILGVFQAIFLSFNSGRLSSSLLNYRATKSSPVESFV